MGFSRQEYWSGLPFPSPVDQILSDLSTVTHPSWVTDSWNVDVHSSHLLFDHFQFTLIHRPNIPCSYAILFFTTSNLASITSPIHNSVLFLLWLHPFILSGVFLHWSPVAYWAPSDWGVHLSVSYLFAFSYCLWGSLGKNTEVVCDFLLQWTTFCQNSPPWPALGGPTQHGL